MVYIHRVPSGTSCEAAVFDSHQQFREAHGNLLSSCSDRFSGFRYVPVAALLGWSVEVVSCHLCSAEREAAGSEMWFTGFQGFIFSLDKGLSSLEVPLSSLEAPFYSLQMKQH